MCETSNDRGVFVWPSRLSQKFLTWAFILPTKPIKTYLKMGEKVYVYNTTTEGIIIQEKDTSIYHLRGKEMEDLGSRIGHIDLTPMGRSTSGDPIGRPTIGLKTIGLEKGMISLSLTPSLETDPAYYQTRVDSPPPGYDVDGYSLYLDSIARLQYLGSIARLQNINTHDFLSFLDSVESKTVRLTFGVVEGGGYGLVVSYHLHPLSKESPGNTVFCCLRFVRQEDYYLFQDMGNFLVISSTIFEATLGSLFFNALSVCSSLPTFNLHLLTSEEDWKNISIQTLWSSGQSSFCITMPSLYEGL
jgi:hypothetical protein